MLADYIDFGRWGARACVAYVYIYIYIYGSKWMSLEERNAHLESVRKNKDDFCFDRFAPILESIGENGNDLLCLMLETALNEF